METTEELLRQLITALNNQSQIEHITLSAFCDKIIRHYKETRAQKTAKSVQTSCKHLLRFFAAHTLVSSISVREAQGLINYLQNQAPSGVYVYYRTLKAVFYIAYDWNYIESNPFVKVKLPRRQQNEVTTINREQLDRVLKAVSNEVLRKIHLFMFLTGLRVGEAVSLTWDSVNLTDGFITIGSENFVTKSKRIRRIPLSNEAVQILTELKPKIIKLGAVVFCKRNGYPYSTDYISKQFKKAVRKVGLNNKIYLHTLRAGYATHLAESGVSLQQIQKLLGHQSYGTTLKYATVNLDVLRKAVSEAFDN